MLVGIHNQKYKNMKDFIATPRQSTALKYLNDRRTRFLLFGGGAGGGKSYLGVAWEVGMCLAYPEIRMFIGRNELKRLMMTTYITFLKFCKAHNLKNGIDWWFDGKYHVIHFYNGSTIDLLDVAYLPSDPLYERFGSSEYTSGWLEEIGEQNFGAYDTLKSRINRHMNKEYNIFPKLLMTCNPKRHWAYYEYYKPWKEGTLPESRVFLQSLYLDNPHTAESYGESLSEIKDKAKKARLMFGDWEYDDDPALLIDRDKMDDMFTSAPRINKARYITCDPARFGDDLTVVLLWQGFHIIGAWKYPKTSVKEVRDILYQLASKWQVPTSNIQVDEDGVGGGVKDFYPGIKGFVNNSSPIRTEQEKKDKLQNYRNLKAQCYYRLADYINLGRISIFKEISPEIKEGLVEDLCHLKSKDPDNDLVQDIVGKDEIKKSLGRSPDYSDAVMIRMQFELNKSGFSVRSG